MTLGSHRECWIGVRKKKKKRNRQFVFVGVARGTADFLAEAIGQLEPKIWAREPAMPFRWAAVGTGTRCARKEGD